MAFEIAPADNAKIEDYVDRLLTAHASGSLTRADVHWELTEVIACASKDLEGEFWDLIACPLEERNRKA